MEANQPPRRFYLLTCPRTASNLLMKILALEQQPNVTFREDGGYFFSPVHLMRFDQDSVGAHVEELTPDQKEQQINCMKNCFKTLLQHVDDAESEGKLVVVKEHTHYLADPVAETRFLYGEESVVEELPWALRGRGDLVQTTDGRSMHNKTLFSDDFLKTWQPTFLIRHPALAFPSLYRASVRSSGEEYAKSARGRRVCQKTMTLRWTRELYDFYAEHFATAGVNANLETEGNATIWPLVLDADDIMTQPAVLAKFCNIIGLDGNKLKYSWEKDERPRRPGIMAFRTTIDNSTTIDPSKAGGQIDIDEEAAKWREEFGEDIGQMVEKYVRAEMPDYIYLKSKRVVA
ncbi:hypothetical protein FQN49_003075 [Arthroderma sp. PD_2]|nr:hypothetical protein FQN49_003075 [Arthroderma sp. PD_2]